MNVAKLNLLKLNVPTTLTSACGQIRTYIVYPTWEYHVRFDRSVGRKKPYKDALDRFKRLNCGLWIRGSPDRADTRNFDRSESYVSNSLKHYTNTDIERQILEKTMTRYWVKPRYYLDDPYQPYHVRHGLKTCRVDFDHRLYRERRKVLLEDTVSDRHFYDR